MHGPGTYFTCLLLNMLPWVMLHLEVWLSSASSIRRAVFQKCLSKQDDLRGKVNVLRGYSIGHCKKKVHMNTCLILYAYLDRAVWISRPNSVRFCLWAWIKNEVYKRKVDTRDKLLVHVWDAAESIKKREDQLGWTTHDLRTRVAKCIEVDGRIVEHSLWQICYFYVTNF